MNWLFFFVGIIIFMVAMMFVSFPAGLYTVFGTHLSNNYTASTGVKALTYDFVFSSVQIPIGGNLGDIFVIFLAVYFAFLVLAARQGVGLLRSLRSSPRRSSLLLHLTSIPRELVRR